MFLPTTKAEKDVLLKPVPDNPHLHTQMVKTLLVYRKIILAVITGITHFFSCSFEGGAHFVPHYLTGAGYNPAAHPEV